MREKSLQRCPHRHKKMCRCRRIKYMFVFITRLLVWTFLSCLNLSILNRENVQQIATSTPKCTVCEWGKTPSRAMKTENKSRKVLKAFACKGAIQNEKEKKAKGKSRLSLNVGVFKQNESSECFSVCVCFRQLEWNWIKLLVVRLSAS